ncbi:MAG: triose-phosphate isomerase [Waddliaceae bacterium]
MVQGARTPVIAGNWKMHKTIEEAEEFINALIPAIAETLNHVYLAVPFTAIKSLADRLQQTHLVIGAQNLNDAAEGAFTGEISGRMLKDAGAKFVIIGHSERRQGFGESNTFINRKVIRALSEGLQPMLCIGETFEEREEGKTHSVLETQIIEGLKGIAAQQIEKMIIAYEPVWAIGKGHHAATPKEAQQEHRYCRGVIADHWGKEAANSLPILYGGSVNPENVRSFLDQPDVDGVLVGGASLCVDAFAQIVNYQTINV